MTKEERIEEVRLKILERLDSKPIEYDGENISFYELAEACRECFAPYTSYMKGLIETCGRKINRKSTFENFFGKDVPFIYKVVPRIYNGEELVNVYFNDRQGNYVGMSIINDNKNMEFRDFDEIRFTSRENVEFLESVKKYFSQLILILNYFKTAHPNIDYSCDEDDINQNDVFEANDGFFQARINLKKLYNQNLGLSNIDDITAATSRSKTHGIIYDYIDFYNEALQKRLNVNINDLNPIYRSLLNRYMGAEKQKELKMEK